MLVPLVKSAGESWFNLSRTHSAGQVFGQAILPVKGRGIARQNRMGIDADALTRA